MASLVRKTISSAVQKARYFSVLADETKDMSKQEQMSIVLRYVDIETASVQERFLTFIHLNSESLCKYILDTLDKFNINPKLMISQGYDGASVMSGRCSGVQQRIKEVAPNAVYIHCKAHILNLVLVDCVKKNSCASDFFCLVQSLYNFMITSKAHVVYIEKQKELHPGKPTRELKRLSDTRWACRALSLDVIASTYDSIIATLECLTDDSDKSKAVEAIGLLHEVHSFRFLSSLIIFQRIMSLTKSLSNQLQSHTIDMSHATSLVLSTVATLEDFRNDSTWDHTYKYICDIATLNNIEITDKSNRRRHGQPRRLDDTITLESTGHRDSVTPSCSESLKTRIYYPVLDHILAELNRRFSSTNLEIMKYIDACNPNSSQFLDSSLLSSLASLYEIDTDVLYNECLLAKRTLQVEHTDNLNTVLEAYRQLILFNLAFPTLVKVFQVALTIVVSTAQCERSFSALKRIKTHLRTTMSNERLADISLLSVEKDITTSATFIEETIHQFEGIDKNRTIILS